MAITQSRSGITNRLEICVLFEIPIQLELTRKQGKTSSYKMNTHDFYLFCLKRSSYVPSNCCSHWYRSSRSMGSSSESICARIVQRREYWNYEDATTIRRARTPVTSPLTASCRPVVVVVTAAPSLGNKSSPSFPRSATANAPTVHGRRRDGIATAGRLVTAVSRAAREGEGDEGRCARTSSALLTREGGIVGCSDERVGVASAELSAEQRRTHISHADHIQYAYRISVTRRAHASAAKNASPPGRHEGWTQLLRGWWGITYR